MEKVIAYIVIIGTPLAVVLFIIWGAIIYANLPEDKDSPTISFDQFIALYRINPKSWELNTNYVRYRLIKRATNSDYIIGYNYKIINFATVADNLKYKKWVKKETKRKKGVQKSKEMVELIAEWQKDIDDAQKANVQRTRELMKKNEEDAKKHGGLNNEA